MSRATSIDRQAEIRAKLAGIPYAADSTAEVEPDRLAENPPQRRTDSEASRLLSILDEIGKGHDES